MWPLRRGKRTDPVDGAGRKRKRARKPFTECHCRQVGPSLYLDEHGDPTAPPYVRYRLFRGPDEERSEGEDILRCMPIIGRGEAARSGQEENEMATKKRHTTTQGQAAAEAGGGQDVVVHATDETFEKEIVSARLPVLVDFSASWCGPCKGLGKVLPAIAEKFAGRVKVLKVDVDESPRTATRFVVEGVPTLVLLKRGKPVAIDCGFGSRRETEAWLQEALDRRARRARR